MTLDWNKPIQFENGEPCELIETRPEGFPCGCEYTRLIVRSSVDTSTMGGVMSSIWYMREDGKVEKCILPGYNVVNKTDE